MLAPVRPPQAALRKGEADMDLSPKQYQDFLKSKNPPSPVWKNTALAFVTGGAICCLGQALRDGFLLLGLDLEQAGTAASIALLFLSALFTGLGLYHKLARYAGAGTLVPITGFANSVVSPAIDFRAEVRCIIGIVRENRNR